MRTIILILIEISQTATTNLDNYDTIDLYGLVN